MVDRHPGFPAGGRDKMDSLVGRRDADGSETDFEVVRCAPEAGDDRRILRKRPEELRPELHPVERCAPEAGDFPARGRSLDQLVDHGRNLAFSDATTRRADLANDIAALVREAHAAGYRLCAEDQAAGRDPQS